jgi:Holliday junction DNA helicase RuvA
MFYYIKGKLVLNEESRAVIDVGGVAYAMTVSANTQTSISKQTFNGEQNVTLFTHLSVREDGIELFGFKDTEELDMFKLLITVSGIGPKAAMSLLSFMTPSSISAAVCTDDKKSISKAPGIGPKTAARIILELKDKLSMRTSAFSDDGTALPVADVNSSKYTEALDALIVLGFNRSAAADTLKSIDTATLEIEDIIREALKKLMK